jgi:hypothetical protein
MGYVVPSDHRQVLSVGAGRFHDGRRLMDTLESMEKLGMNRSLR